MDIIHLLNEMMIRNSTVNAKKVAYVGPTPAYYFVPFLKLLAAEPNVDLTVYWGCDEAAKNYTEKDFSAEVNVQENLLEGYKYKFLNNTVGRATYQKGFWALNSIDFFSEFKKNKYDVVIIHGWQYLNNINAILAAKIFGSKVFLRAETPLNQELMKSKFNKFLKFLLLPILFRFIDKFLYIGEQNRNFYLHHGIKASQMFFSPYSVDNKLFQDYKIQNRKNRLILREKYQIKNDEVTFLFVGKFIHKKRVMLLLKAIKELKPKDIRVILVGSGIQDEELRDYVKTNELNLVVFAGYQPQHLIKQFYLISDVFILPSDLGETWGLVVNEALNFGLPIIVSDVVGSGIDLCLKGNGMIFKSDNFIHLSQCISMLEGDSKLREAMSKSSLDLTKLYSPENTVAGIIEAINKYN